MKVPCNQCHKLTEQKQITLALWKKENKKLYLCPVCFSDFFRIDLKATDVSKGVKELNKNKVFQGVTDLDIKSYLEKWSRNIKEKH